MVITWKGFNDALTPSIQGQVKLRKLAGLFAGLGHLQPLLLATTNSHYLLDRFCMERCCSGEYISRIVTSLIFMEVIATLLVACTVVGIACTNSSEWEDTTGLNKWNQNEERYRGYISSAIQCLILVGYLQILISFTTGGKKGHMHWFYVSLMIQQFVCLLIGGAIGFWEGGVTLWYLVTLPMAPIIVFFYQLMIHSWIRNNGPRDAEYLVVEWQIGLALCISTLATLFWAQGYVVSYIPIELDIATTGKSASADPNRIATGNVTLTTAKICGEKVTVTRESGGLTEIGLANVKADVTLTTYSLTLVIVDSGPNQRFATLTLKAGVKIVFASSNIGADTVKVESATRDHKKEVTLNTSSSTLENVKVYPGTIDVKKSGQSTVEIALIAEAEGTIESSSAAIDTVTVTIPVDIKVKETTPSREGGRSGESGQSGTITSVKLTLPTKPSAVSTAAYSEDRKLNLEVSGGNPLNITVEAKAGAAQPDPKAKFVKVSGTGFTPKAGNHCVYSVVDDSNRNKRDIWANIVGQCSFAACYKKSNKALLCLYLRSGGGLTIKYFGTENTSATAAARNPWYEISEDDFIQKLPAFASGGRSFSISKTEGTPTPQYNRDFDNILPNVWFPLVMHGMAVGSFGSIFPNLIPKTLVCARSSRTLSVVSIFLSPLPGIFNVMFADNGWPSAACAWTVGSGIGWIWAYSLYIFYGLAILFAIFNAHSPEWKLCCYIRSHGWMPFMMTLSITLIIEILIAIARAGIMMQKPAADKDKNHPLLWNKIACLLSLSYLPFWLTTTPMMKSYVSSLDPFLCDKDRDHWPTARYGAWRSGWYWCKCACRGLYNSPRKLVTLNMRKALTRKDPKMYFLVTHDIPPEEWLWTLSSIIILILPFLNHHSTSYCGLAWEETHNTTLESWWHFSSSLTGIILGSFL